jgi:hypothetical protein
MHIRVQFQYKSWKVERNWVQKSHCVVAVAQKHFFSLGGYFHWDYEDKMAIGYCPYIPFVFSFGILLIFWTVVCMSLIVCLTVECIGKVIYPKYHKHGYVLSMSTTKVI